MSKDILALAKQQEEYIIATRRYLHQRPERPWQEWETTKFIEDELIKMGLEPKRFDDEHTGLYCMIKGGKAKEGAKTILLRADIDALSVTEDTGLPYASQNPGVMHACGHDAHAAMLLGAAKILVDMQDELCGNVKLLFQAAEETAIGAKWYVEQGVMDDVDVCYGCHIGSMIDTGYINVEPGPRFAACDEFKVVVEGIACHGGMPYVGRDSILAASTIVCSLQNIVSRRIDSQDALVITVGYMHGGTDFNIVCGKMELGGTVRSYNAELRAAVPDMMREVLENTAKAFGCTARLEYQYKTPAIVHEDEQMNRLARAAAVKIFGEGGLKHVKALGGGDDFAYYMEKKPGIYAMLGGRNEAKGCAWGHHHPKFDVDEDAFWRGTAMFVQMTLDYFAD
ncbi:MAG: amidohydrolase [Oscillospiraceae bacterium]|nr:amidohydrolase [Oscillospiraceae bacterium]